MGVSPQRAFMALYGRIFDLANGSEGQAAVDHQGVAVDVGGEGRGQG
jgi:hypothetical protein